MRDESTIWKNIDWVSIIMFFVLVLMGWLNIYASIYDPELDQSIFAKSNKAGSQFLWIVVSLVLVGAIMVTDFKFFLTVPFILYGVILLLLAGVLIVGKEVNGARSWYEIGSFRLQPAEFSKFACALALAKYLSTFQFKYGINKHTLITLAIIFVAPVLIILQNETGTVLIFMSLIIVLYLDGLNFLIPLAGIVLIAIFVCTLLYEFMYVSLGIGLIWMLVSIIMRKYVTRILLGFGVAVIGFILLHLRNLRFQITLRNTQQ